ncbi:MAG: PAS domain S-box protein, partial [Legionella sp.]
MDIHKLLKRQLEKFQLKLDEPPKSNEQWVEFISRVSQSYVEADQDRYMNERSMEIFSREMMGLNAMLEKAQRIACMGYWSYDGLTDVIIWSRELYDLFRIDAKDMPTTYESFMERVHEQDREELRQRVDKALNEKVDYECDFRFKDSQGNYRWYQTIAQCKEGEKQLTGVIVDIHKKKDAEEKIKELNNKIISTARRAGMAEVATSVLHNIGNILNSSNVSATLLKKGINQPVQQRLIKIVEMLIEHKENMVDFLTNDPKGKLIPEYLTPLAKMIIEEQEKNNHEIDNLTNDLNHIKEIVSMQSSISGVSSI